MKDPALELAFSGGIDQSQRAEVLDPRASFVMLENVRAPKRGGVTKRYGFGAHASATRVDATTRTAGYRMFAAGKKTCVIDRDVIDVSGDPNEALTIGRGRVPECGLSMMQTPMPPGKVGAAGGVDLRICTDAVLVSSTYLVLAYVSGMSVYTSVVEAATGMVLQPPTLIYTGTSTDILGLLGTHGAYAVLFVSCSGEANIQASELDTGDLTAGWTVATSFASDAHTSFERLSVQSMSNRIAVAYVNNSAGTSRLTVFTYQGGSGGTVLQTQTVNTNSVRPDSVALDGSIADTLWVAWNESTTVRVIGLDADSLSSTLATVASLITTTGSGTTTPDITVVASATAGAGRLFVNDGGVGLRMRSFTTSVGAVAASGAAVVAYNVTRAGKPFVVGSRYYAPCYGYDGTEDACVLCDLSDANAWVRPVANVAPRLAVVGYTAAKSAAKTAREHWYPIGVRITSSDVAVQMARFDFDAPYRWRPVEHNGVTFLTGGLVSYFDGVRVAESGFVIRPPAASASDAGSGSGLTGSFKYVLTYSQVDAAGNVHLSGVSTPSTSPSITDNHMLVEVRPLGISARISAATDQSVRVDIWRTVAGGEPPYYYVGSVANTLTGATQNYTDSTSDASLISSRTLMGTGELPGTGAQQDRRAPPGMDHLVSYNGFLVGALGETLYWSGQDVGGEGTWWNPIFQQPVSGGGDITALECQDGTVYAFKRERIFALAGQPPADNGEGGLGAPTRLAVDIGARLPFTCVTSLGIFFVSDRGIELLNRSRSVDFIGEGVQDTFASFPHVTSMTYDADSSCVIIEAASGFSAGLGTGTGRTFVFDTRTRVWRSIDRRAVSVTADVVAQDGCMAWDGSAYRYAWLRSNGLAYVEDHETKLDPGDVWVRQYAKTSNIHLAGLQGEQHIDRMLLLGDYVADHDLEIGIANDYSDTFVAETYDSDALEALTLYVIDKDIDQKTGQAIQVEIEDATPTGAGDTTSTGEGADWVALTFAGMGKGGVRRTSGVERGGT